jgi:hypothetical protein
VTNLAALLFDVARRLPDRPAVSDDRSSRPYPELAERVARLHPREVEFIAEMRTSVFPAQALSNAVALLEDRGHRTACGVGGRPDMNFTRYCFQVAP